MHEFILHSQIRAERYEQVIGLLAGVTAAHPVKIREQCVVYQQLKLAEATLSRKGLPVQPTSAARLNYHRIVRDLNRENGTGGEWRLRTEEWPEAGVKNVTARGAVDSKLSEDGLARFRRDSECYSRSGEYVTMGVRFVHRNVVIRTWRLFTANLDATEDPIDSSPSQLGRLVPIDPSGAYTIEACVRMEDSSNSTLREQAIKELQAFEESMKGAIDFRVPDRMALDPRVK